MGKWMALNLLKAGFSVTVTDLLRKPVEELGRAGATAASSPAGMAGQVDWVLLSLPNTDVVERVIFGEDGLVAAVRRGLVIVDLGTTSYLATLDFQKRLSEQDVFFVDAPVSGMEARAKDATLTIMFGGADTIFQELKPVFNAMGNKVVHMGAAGSGQLAKLINQLLFNISCAAIAEMLPMAVKLGLDPEKVTEVVTSGTGRSFAAEFFAPLALEGIFDRGYALKNAYKDMVSAAEISARLKIPLPMTSAATTIYQMALSEGYGDLGKGAMIRVFERLLGVEFRKGSNE